MRQPTWCDLCTGVIWGKSTDCLQCVSECHFNETSGDSAVSHNAILFYHSNGMLRIALIFQGPFFSCAFTKYVVGVGNALITFGTPLAGGHRNVMVLITGYLVQNITDTKYHSGALCTKKGRLGCRVGLSCLIFCLQSVDVLL